MKMKELQRLLYVLAAAVFFIGLFVLCDRLSDDVISEYSSRINPSIISGKDGDASLRLGDVTLEDKIFHMVEEDHSVDMELTVTGEILCQNQQLVMAYNESSQSFDFKEGLKYLKDILSGKDLCVTALGTTMAGRDNGYSSETYGYCAVDGMYNSPESLAGDLKDAGFNLLSTATNHALDSGVSGVGATITNLENAGISHVGTAAGENDSKEHIVKNNYVNIVFTGYTAGTNEQELPEDSRYAVNTLDNLNESSISEMCIRISELKESNDYIIVLLNFGSADSNGIEDSQREVARELTKAGADLILGTGSRSIKPMERLSVTDEKGNAHNSVVFYGLGCIYSSDYYTEYENLDTDISLVINLTLRNSISGKVRLTGMEVIPVYLNWYNDLVQPVPVCEARDSEKFNDVLDENDMIRIDNAYSSTVEHLLDGTGLKASYNSETYSYNIAFN